MRRPGVDYFDAQIDAETLSLNDDERALLAKIEGEEGRFIPEQGFRQRDKLLSNTLASQIETSDWLGESAYAVPVSRENNPGMNFVVEWDGEETEITRLAVECLGTDEPEVIHGKEKYAREGLRRNNLSTVNSFESEADPDFYGNLYNVPRVILSLDQEGLQRLCLDVLTKKPKEMAQNPEQLLILEQIKKQMFDQMLLLFKNFLEQIKIMPMGGEEMAQKRDLALETLSLRQNPENLISILDKINEKDKLMKALEISPELNHCLKNIEKLRKVFELVTAIELEKNGSLKPSVIEQAAQQKEQNNVIRINRERINSFQVPRGMVA